MPAAKRWRERKGLSGVWTWKGKLRVVEGKTRRERKTRYDRTERREEERRQGGERERKDIDDKERGRDKTKADAGGKAMAKWPKWIIRPTLPSRFWRGVVCEPQAAIGRTSGFFGECGADHWARVEKGELIRHRGQDEAYCTRISDRKPSAWRQGERERKDKEREGREKTGRERKGRQERGDTEIERSLHVGEQLEREDRERRRERERKDKEREGREKTRREERGREEGKTKGERRHGELERPGGEREGAGRGREEVKTRREGEKRQGERRKREDKERVQGERGEIERSLHVGE
jgi:hypothetical protein